MTDIKTTFWFNCKYEVGVSKLDLIISRACHNDIQYHPRLCGKGNLSPPSGKLQQHCSGDPQCLLLLFQKENIVCTVFLLIVVIFLKKKHPNSIENSVPLQWECIVFVQELFV